MKERLKLGDFQNILTPLGYIIGTVKQQNAGGN